MDKTAFRIQTFAEAENTRAFWLTKTPAERWAAAWYLTCAAWNIDHNKPPRLDKNCFSMRKNG